MAFALFHLKVVLTLSFEKIGQTLDQLLPFTQTLLALIF